MIIISVLNFVSHPWYATYYFKSCQVLSLCLLATTPAAAMTAGKRDIHPFSREKSVVCCSVQGFEGC